MHRGNIRWLVAFLAAFIVLSWVSDAFAEDDVPWREGPIVRRKLLYRSTRFEASPFVGFTINDAYRRNMLVGANLAFHLTNEFGIALNAGYGVVQFDTSLSDNIQTTLEKQSPSKLAEISYSYIQWALDLGLSYVPIFGKFSLLKSTSINYDFHLNGGVSLVNEAVEAAVDGGATDEAISGLRPGGMLGFGMRFFLSDGISLNLDLKDYIYSRAEISASQSGEPELSNTFLGTVSVSFFFPGEVKVSR